MYKRGKALSLVTLLIIICIQLLQIEFVASQGVITYYPSGYNLLGATALVSGTPTDLQSDNGVYMTFRSYQTATSGQSLYAHSETTTIAGAPYYLQKLTSADGPATSLSASMATTGRQLLGKSVYPLTAVSSIPASTWTLYYRGWYSGVTLTVATKNASSTSGAWTTPDGAYADGGLYAYTTSATAPGSQQNYGGYGFNIPTTASITKVRVRLDAWTAGNEQLKLEASEDGGSTFLATTATYSLTTTETTYWTDVTGWTTWTPSKINSDKIWIRVSALKVGGAAQVNLDWAPIEVTYGYLPAAHADIDVLIRQSDGTIRTTPATNVANSGALTETATTLSGTFSWSAYTVVDQTDYLEMDYYVDVTTAQSGVTAYLRIDDNTLAPADQTRVANIMLPSQYTVEVEFTGTSNTYALTQLLWLVDSAWATGSVSVTLQLYNYATASYPTTGNGYIAYTSSTTPTDETKSQTITTSPANFRNTTTSEWKIKIKGVKSTTTQFDLNADFIKYETTWTAEHDVAVLEVTPSATEAYSTWTKPINITVVVKNEGPIAETFNVTAYYNTTAIGIETVTSLAPGTNATLVFQWSVSGVSVGNYVIKAEASIIPGEADTLDNTLTDGTVRMKFPGDATGNNFVDVSDFTILAGSWFKAAGQAGYDSRADFTGNDFVDVSDFAILAGNWFKGP